jgi:hypothetical protein
MSEWVPTWKPAYPASLHPDVISECSEGWANGQPWTVIRELRKGVDDPEGQRCIGSQGKHHLECDERVEGVQYTTAFGDPVFYCEKHALEQHAWDQIFYHSKPRPRPEPSEEWKAEVGRLMAKIQKKKQKKEEPEEVDPTA